MISLYAFALFAFSMISGALAAVLGLGGGSILMPALTLQLGIDFHYAAATAIISVIAASIGMILGSQLKSLVNLRLVLMLSMTGGAGALLGAHLSPVIQTRYLFLLFSFAVILCLLSLSFPTSAEPSSAPASNSNWLRLDSCYFDMKTQTTVGYRVSNVLSASLMIFGIGTMSGLLGLGGGALMVTTIYRRMRVPLRVSIITSNLIMGVTGLLSAESFREAGLLVPSLIIPVTAGALVGSSVGARIGHRIHPSVISVGLRIALLLIALQMAVRFFRP